MSKIQAVLKEHAFHLITPMRIDDPNGPWEVECNCDAAPIQGPSFLRAEAEFALHQAKAVEAALFSNEAIERAARELARHRWQDAINVWDSLGQDAKDRFRDQARVVVAALKGDA